MPYVFVDELPDGVEEANVVPLSDYDSLQQDLADMTNQRDEAIERAVTAEEGWKKSKEKFANTFLSTPTSIKDDKAQEPLNLTAQNIESLFKIG